MTDDRIAELYGLPLERFTAERNALAAELRAEGQQEAATEVKALRKPNSAAWAVNQVVRAEPDLVEALLGAGGELRQAHRQAASGHGAEQLRAAAEAERRAVEQLMACAPGVLGSAPSAALGEAMRNTLHAASSDDDARELIRSGTLTHDLRPVGLGPIPGLGTSAKPRKADARQLRAAAEATTALEREVLDATRALERADAAYTRARDAAEEAAERLKDVRKRLREARAGLDEARRRQAGLERD